MELLILAAPLLVIFLALPLMTGWVATTSGRGFWFWAGLTCLLPGITIIILVFLPDKKKVEIKKA